MIEETDTDRIWLRRYSNEDTCTGEYRYHNAMVFLRDAPIIYSDREANGHHYHASRPKSEMPDKTDPRWPAKCQCGYVFKDTDEYQLFNRVLYKRVDTNELFILRDAPVGAMWESWWRTCDIGPDGKSYMVRCPDGHDWCIDSRASNCDMMDDNIHKCWVRHGTAPDFTVDKNGHTCHAGAGSILTPKWHGFLTNGYLSESRNP